MTFSEMYGIQLDRRLATTDTTARFTTVRRKAAINEGVRKFNEKTGCYTDRVSISLSDGTGEYDLETAGIVSGENYLRPAEATPSLAITTIADSSVRYIEGAGLPWAAEEGLNQHANGWRARGASTPGHLYVRQKAGSLYLGLTPAPDIPATETWALLFPYVAIPPTLSGDSDVPFSGLISLFPYHEAICDYAAGVLEELRKNYQMVDRRMAIFGAAVVQYRIDQAPPNGAQIRLATNWRGRLQKPSAWASA